MTTTRAAPARRAFLTAAGLAASGIIAAPASAQRRFDADAPPQR